MLRFDGKRRTKIEEIIRSMLREFNINDQFTLPHIRASMTLLFDRITEQYHEDCDAELAAMHNEYRESVRKTLDYINQNYTEKIYLRDISKIAHMSPNRFELIFKHIIGMTFTEYLVYLRVLKARDLLMKSDKTLYDICRSCGFQSEVYFCRVFKEKTGRRPSAYRSRNLKGRITCQIT